MMKKIFKILLAVISILVVGVLMLYLFTNKFERKLNILDCEGIYYKGLFEKPKPGYLDFSENNAKVDIANCLCEKYIKNKDTAYKKEIIKDFFNSYLNYIKSPLSITTVKVTKQKYMQNSNIKLHDYYLDIQLLVV